MYSYSVRISGPCKIPQNGLPNFHMHVQVQEIVGFHAHYIIIVARDCPSFSMLALRAEIENGIKLQTGSYTSQACQLFIRCRLSRVRVDKLGIDFKEARHNHHSRDLC